MGCGNLPTTAPERYGERMPGYSVNYPDEIIVAGDAPLMAIACQKCRQVQFSRSPEDAVQLGLGHAVKCGTSDLIIAEIVKQR